VLDLRLEADGKIELQLINAPLPPDVALDLWGADRAGI
jgi:hypothetical protein